MGRASNPKRREARGEHIRGQLTDFLYQDLPTKSNRLESQDAGVIGSQCFPVFAMLLIMISTMTTLDLALDVVQFVVLLVLSAANGVMAYSVFRIQKDRNTPKLVVYMELVEDDDHEYLG